MFKFKALICEHLYIFTEFLPITLYLQDSSVVMFNGLNYLDWSEQIQFCLGVLDFDLALLPEKTTAITDKSNAEERSLYKTWERLNRLSLMFM